jgi:adenine deaminase
MTTTPLADLVIKNVTILNVLTDALEVGDVAIKDDIIVGVYDEYGGVQEVDGTGKFVVPGFIDTHLHIESSLVTPLEFDRMVLMKGTTTAFPDPHELANVIGTKAFDYFLECAAATVMDLRVNFSSCVPATNIGTSGARIMADDIAPYVNAKHGHGLAEVMNLAAVLGCDPDMLRKIDMFDHVDGHMPGVTDGRALNHFAAHRIWTDHECTTMEEALEKHKRGIRVLIREGTGCKNLEALMPFITTERSYSTAFCTDDFHPADIVGEGHLDYVIRKAISLYDPALHGDDKDVHIANIYRMASYAAAEIFGMNSGRRRYGEVAAGRVADLVLLNDLESCDVAQVIKDGQLVTEQSFENRPGVDLVGLNSIKSTEIDVAQLQIKSADLPAEFEQQGDRVEFPVSEVYAGNVLTGEVLQSLAISDGAVQSDVTQDILKVAVVERHGNSNGNVGIGFVKGFGFNAGAIASSVGHDDHNITVVGANDDDMAAAVNAVTKMQGGYVAVKDGEVLASVSLPIAGLMSDRKFESVAADEVLLREMTDSLVADGHNKLPQPLISIAFIALSVIPNIRITDAGITRNPDGLGPTLIFDQRKP